MSYIIKYVIRKIRVLFPLGFVLRHNGQLAGSKTGSLVLQLSANAIL